MTEIFTLGAYPVVIEPTLNVLEATGGTDSSDSPLRLRRLATEEVRRSFLLPEQLVHFFGDGDLDTVKHILCYTPSGRLSHFLRLTTEWELTELPVELTGQSVLKPSARFVFKDVRSRTVFLHYLQQVIDGKIQNPTISVMMDSLVEPIRQIEVWESPIGKTEALREMIAALEEEIACGAYYIARFGYIAAASAAIDAAYHDLSELQDQLRDALNEEKRSDE